jgi:hypothetical protein
MVDAMKRHPFSSNFNRQARAGMTRVHEDPLLNDCDQKDSDYEKGRLTCQTTIPTPTSSTSILLNILNRTPRPSPSTEPKLICFTAAGFRPPSLNTGVLFFALLPGELENSAESDGAGEVSLCVGRPGVRKGIEARPRATANGLRFFWLACL